MEVLDGIRLTPTALPYRSTLTRSNHYLVALNNQLLGRRSWTSRLVFHDTSQHVHCQEQKHQDFTLMMGRRGRGERRALVQLQDNQKWNKIAINVESDAINLFRQSTDR